MVLRCWNIKATIWQNVSKKGPFSPRPFLTYSKIGQGPGVTASHSASMTSIVVPRPIMREDCFTGELTNTRFGS